MNGAKVISSKDHDRSTWAWNNAGLLTGAADYAFGSIRPTDCFSAAIAIQCLMRMAIRPWEGRLIDGNVLDCHHCVGHAIGRQGSIFFVANTNSHHVAKSSIRALVPLADKTIDMLDGEPSAELLNGLIPGEVRIWKGEYSFF